MTLSGCTSSSDDATYTLGTLGDTFVRSGLVRQGHAMTHIALYDLEFQYASTGSVYGPFATFTPAMQPSSPNCNGFSNFPCSDFTYLDRVGSVPSDPSSSFNHESSANLTLYATRKLDTNQ